VLASPATFKPFYQKDQELALTSWPTDGWKHGGAPVWGWLSYDPELDLVFYGTGNPGPWNTEQRPGDNRWSTSVLARNPGDGTLRWAYQFTPADNWDYDSTQEMILTELTLNGQPRKVLVHFDKNGFVYTLDRATGELLSAEPYVPVNWARRIDLKTGRPEVDSTKLTGASRGTVKDICPSLEGGKNQQPAAWSPVTRLFYLSTSNMCMDYTSFHAAYMAGTPYLSAGAPYTVGPGGNCDITVNVTFPSATFTSGTNVTTRACAGNLSPLLTRQKESWSFVDRGQFGEPATTGGTPLRVFASVNLANQACLGTVNGSTAIGADVRVFPCNTSNTDQNWVFTR